MRIKNRKVLVVGLAKSGVAAANFLLKKGAHVTITDLKSCQELQKEIGQLEGKVRLALGGHTEADFLNADLIVISPGVPTRLSELKHAVARGIPILSEVELAYPFLDGKIIGITGSNGKTTTTALIGEIFKNAGRDAVVAGNIGTPLIQFAEAAPAVSDRVYVVELSSFQLENVRKFKCDIALLLNVTPDHLDRYVSFEDYALAKERIFMNQTRRDYAVLNVDNSLSLSMAEGRKSQVVLFSRRQRLSEGIYVDDRSIYIRWKDQHHHLMPVKDIRLQGGHNLENVLAATAAGFLSGVELGVMAETFRKFAGVEHRLEFTRRVDGVDYYNDSKGTNVDSATQGIQALDQRLILIMGGKDKGGDFTVLRSLVGKKAKLLILIGAATEKIFAALGQEVETVRAKDMKEAVELARSRAVPGDAVLLEPGCASFDMFQNYEHRGRVFKEIVHALPGE
ncbi:MAG: UDP-N-acetylmuramoyl-L-alanine--D-glutamate ligase [Acidobacteria bacterium]|nr:MAG: UDP-N-acetylmuramoyl-L-alanine--D-glutamate ligase [Acidobacteriota bacterium]